jgi:hypothetical protein
MKGKSYQKKVSTDVRPGITEDGELKNIKVDTYVTVHGKEHFTIWLSDLTPVIQNITQLADFKVMYWIGMNMKTNSGQIYLTILEKRQIEEEMKIGQSAINGTIATLKAYGVIKPLHPKYRIAAFKVNPQFIWKGDRPTRERLEREWLEEKRIAALPDKERKELEAVERATEAFEISKLPQITGHNFQGVQSAA